MLSEEEKKFLVYWERNRTKNKSFFSQLRYGLPIGIGIAVLILLNLTSGWYARAAMVANSQSTPFVLLIALAAIIIFWSVFANRHKWDLNEQRYKELNYKKNKEEVNGDMQQDTSNSSQSK